MNLVSEAHRNLAAHFRSIHVATGQDAGSARLQPSAPVLARWLTEYQEAYTEAQAPAGEASMHAMYGRSLTLEGDTLLTATEDVVLLGETATRCGLSTTLYLPITALTISAHSLPALHDALAGVRFRIDCTSLSPQASTEALNLCRSTLLAHARRGGNIALVGDLATLRATGLFEQALFNQAFVTVHPPPSGGVRPQHKARSSSPCRNYIAWFVNRAGDLFPCAGLASHGPARFGSIHEPFAGLIDSLACSGRRIEELAHRGPHLDVEDTAYPADLCALHRQQVHGIASL
jgi:hypothetical protein